MAPLVPCPVTVVMDQDYQDYPENMGPDSRIPRNWDNLANIPLTWTVGDVLVLRQTRFTPVRLLVQTGATSCSPPSKRNVEGNTQTPR